MKPMLTATLLLSALAALPTKAVAGEFAVVSVIRTLPLKKDEPVVKDYYINAGTNNGLKQGAIIDARRKMPVYDNLAAKVVADTHVPVARLKLIHVDKGMSIARMVELYDRKTTPIGGYDDVLVGDLIKVSDKQ